MLRSQALIRAARAREFTTDVPSFVRLHRGQWYLSRKRHFWIYVATISFVSRHRMRRFVQRDKNPLPTATENSSLSLSLCLCLFLSIFLCLCQHEEHPVHASGSFVANSRLHTQARYRVQTSGKFEGSKHLMHLPEKGKLIWAVSISSSPRKEIIN